MKLNVQLFAEGQVVIEVGANTKQFEKQMKFVENEMQEIEYKLKQADLGSEVGDVSKLESQYEKLSNQLLNLNEQKRKFNEQPPKPPLPKDFSNILNESEKKLDNIIKKVGKWAIAVFGIRSAYSLIRSSISTLSQYNEKLKNDIENIRYGIASALAPIIEKIVQWAYKLMQAINYVWKILTGKNLFSNMNKNLGTANKQAKELKKTIAGFDELNVVSSSSSASGGIGGGFNAEDLTGTNLLTDKDKERLEKVAEILNDLYKNILKPLWEKVLNPIGKWLIENPEVLIGLVSTLIGFKIGSKIANLTGLIGTSSSGLIGGLALLDLYLATKIIKTVKDELIPTIKDTEDRMKSATNLVKSQSGSWETATDKLLKSVDANELNNEQLKTSVDLMIKSIKQNKKQNEQITNNAKVTDLLTGAGKLNNEVIKQNIKSNETLLNTLTQLYNNEKLDNEQKKEYINLVIQQIDWLEKQNASLSKNSNEYKNNKKKIEDLKLQLDKTKGDYNVNVNTKADKSKVDELGNSIKKVEGTHKVEFDASTKKANKTISNWLSNMGSSLFTTLFPGVGTLTSVIKKFPFAKGGIVNLPGKGVPIAGEVSREGVIPLTDSQQMMLLGQEIGKWITLNLTNVTTLDGRTIDRKVSQVHANDNFLRND